MLVHKHPDNLEQGCKHGNRNHIDAADGAGAEAVGVLFGAAPSERDRLYPHPSTIFSPEHVSPLPYRTALDDLASACHALEKAEIEACHQRTFALKLHRLQRIAVDNLGREAFEGLAEFEPWALPPNCGGPAQL